MTGKEMVEAVRTAANAHKATWGMMVPNHFVVDLSMEPVEEAAYAGMEEAKAELRAHIRVTYGISIRELSVLAMP